MKFELRRSQRWCHISVLTLVAFCALTARFSPNWFKFFEGIREIRSSVGNEAPRLSVDKAILSGFSSRGWYVTRQAVDLATKVDEPNHLIVRWRVFFPFVAHWFRLPPGLLLGLAHVGCAALVLWLIHRGVVVSEEVGRHRYEAIYLALIVGASAPFFTSMGLLGYYDSWVAIALIVVGWAPQRWPVLLACVIAPWIDERFVIGFPLAIVVRWLRADPPSFRAWLVNEAMRPSIGVVCYAVVRLMLSKAAGSQPVGDYFRQFVFSRRLTLTDYAHGIWAGLRLNCVLVILAIWNECRMKPGRRAWILAGGAVGTLLLGLATALDLSRSTLLILPVAVLGWDYLVRRHVWKNLVMPLLAVLALALPAEHVVGRTLRPVDSFVSAPTPLLDAEDGIGVMYLTGDHVPANFDQAFKWLSLAAERGNAGSCFNLGTMYERGEGFPKDMAAAMKWYLAAAQKGEVRSLYNLGVIYDEGKDVKRDRRSAESFFRRAAELGFPPAQNRLGALLDDKHEAGYDPSAAVEWYRVAAYQGFALAQRNLAVKYAQGAGVPRDDVKAVAYFRLSANQGLAESQNDLGAMYFNGVGIAQNAMLAAAWFELAAAQGHAEAGKNLAIVARQLDSEQMKQVRIVAEQIAQANRGDR